MKTYKRPEVLRGVSYRFQTPSGTAFITINGDENNIPVEVIIHIGKCGDEITAIADTLARFISRDLQQNHGAIGRVLETLQGVKSTPVIQTEGQLAGKPIYSLPDAIYQAIKLYCEEFHKQDHDQSGTSCSNYS